MSPTPAPASTPSGRSPGLAPLPPIPSLPRGGEPSGGSPGTARSALRQMISGLSPVAKHVGDIQTSLQALGRTGLIDPGVISQLRVLTGALIPMALQGVISPAGPQAGAPPAMGQGPLGANQGAIPPPGPPGGPGGPQPLASMTPAGGVQ